MCDNILNYKHQMLTALLEPNLLLLIRRVFWFVFIKIHGFVLLLSLVALDSLGGPFPSTSHRCHHKPKRCLPIHCGSVGGPLPISPLLFHPNAKGSQIVMDLAQKTAKRQASFCNAITFSNRPIALYEQVRLKVHFSQSGALFLSSVWELLNCQNCCLSFILAWQLKGFVPQCKLKFAVCVW